MKIGCIKTSSKRYGGKIHEQQVMKVLSEEFDVELVDLTPRRFEKIMPLKILELFLRLLNLKGKKDIWIRDFISVVTLPLDRTQGKNIALIHHIDFSDSPLFFRIIFFFLGKVFYYNLKKVDAIVTVCEYWQNYFLNKGYSNVYKIYNAFNLADFNISEEEIMEFKKRFDLEGKPIIYIGNCQKGKGVVEIWQELRDLDIYLITSGEKTIDIPVKNFDLKYRDYLRLLGASSIIIEMHKFKTGWSRISHEAMLLKKPVIGSGIAAMEELLKGGNQIICKDFSSLREKVEYLLNHPEMREKLGEEGYNFAKNFTMERFKENWVRLIKELSSKEKLS